MSDFDRSIRYWHVCLIRHDEDAIAKLQSFIGKRATYAGLEEDENRDIWAILDVRDHSVLDELAYLDFVALTPADNTFAVQAWPGMAHASPH